MFVRSKFIVEINNFCRSSFKNVPKLNNLFVRSPECDLFTGVTPEKEEFSSRVRKAFEPIAKSASDVFNIRSKVKKTLGTSKEDITVNVVSQEAKNNFLTHLLGSDSEFENCILNAHINSFGHKGLPLKYSRKNFISDLNKLTKILNDDEKQTLFSKMEMSVNYNYFGTLISYDGMPTLKNFEKSNPLHLEISKIVTMFTEQNEVISDDKALNKSMNILLKAMPEYVNIMGKQQHNPQKFSLDCHILKVLQFAISNKDYEALNFEDKAAAKMMILFHDISKKEGIVDKMHPMHSAGYANTILAKFNLSHAFSSRVKNLVRNHHWLELFNKGKFSANDVAELFSENNDYMIAKIFAEADLKGVCPKLFEKYGEALSPQRQASIEDALKILNQKNNGIEQHVVS